MSDYGVVTSRDTVRLERVLPGPIERVWDYLTKSELRGTWLATGEMDLRPGGKVVHIFRNNSLTPHDDPPPAKYASTEDYYRMEGRVTACDPPRVLAYTWPEADNAQSEVRFDLTPRGDSVLLVVTHTRLASRETMVGVGAGWHTHLNMLADRLAGHTPDGFWRTYVRLEADYEKLIPAAGAEAPAS